MSSYADEIGYEFPGYVEGKTGMNTKKGTLPAVRFIGLYFEYILNSR